MSLVRRAATVAAAIVVCLGAWVVPSAAQDAADAKKLNAPIFTVELPNITPRQTIDLVQVVLPFWLDNPDVDWLPLELIARSETTLRWARNTRGGGWTKVGAATEVDV